MRNGAGLPLR
uniref:Uncharacterized protein n=1 Tax=Anguilla anguilla TaxID=7936 RepID=A0A0E9RYA3_ANGAN